VTAAIARLLSAVASRQRIAEPVVVLAAHPDDETLALSVALPLFDNLTLVHATASADIAETNLRRDELDEALRRLGCRGPHRVSLGMPDGDLVSHAAHCADALVPLLNSAAFCLTHAFEGGHPDHDACALAVAIALGWMGTSAPVLAEFAVYALNGGKLLTTRFANGRGTIMLTPQEAVRKRHALEAFTSQQHVVDRFPLDGEALAAAPSHDFLIDRDATSVLFARSDASAPARWREAATAQWRAKV
jgi:N-acetylglucosamine malate deacetylase 2